MERDISLNDPATMAMLRRLATRPSTARAQTVHEQVMARLAPAYIAASQRVLLASVIKGGIKSAPLTKPPIATGLTDTLERLHAIVKKNAPCSREEYSQIPGLLRRIRELLRVYYDAHLTGNKISNFKYCDIQNIDDVGLKLHEIGLFLQLSPARFGALMNNAPDMAGFLLDEPLDVGKWRSAVYSAHKRLLEDTEVSDEDREQLGELDQAAQQDQAAYQLAFFVGDMLVALVMNKARDKREKLWAEKALKKLVEYSTLKVDRDAFGDALTDAMVPIYRNQDALVRFCQAGGIGALIGDWAESSIKDTVCKDAIETLPDAAWNRQTVESLDVVTREINNKITHDGSPAFVTTRLFATMMHNIYSRYGVVPFERAADSLTFNDQIYFYFIHRRIKNKKRRQRLTNMEEWMRLMEKYVKVPRATRQRHAWAILSVSSRWDCLDLYGCANPTCSERRDLERLKERRIRGVRDHVIEDRLFAFGAQSQVCVACKSVSYCNKSCQVTHWQEHKVQCQKEAVKDNNEDIE